MSTLQPYYVATEWQNLPNMSTPINRTNLYHAEKGIKEADNRICQLDMKKADIELVNSLVKMVSLDSDTGILTVTLQNGSSYSYDLDIEKVVTNFTINDNNELVLTLADGTEKVIDLARFVYSVDSTATVSMKIQNRTITAEIVDGSVTMGKLDVAVQAEFRQYMVEAQAARDAALQYQKFAKRYTLGDEEFPGSEIDNAKYYYEQISEKAKVVSDDALAARTQAEISTQQATLATQKAIQATQSANSAGADALTATDKADIASKAATTATQQAGFAKEKANVAVEKAAESENNADLAKRYAKGGVIPEDKEDNAEWYYQQTKALKAEVDAASKIVVPRFYIDFATGKLMSDTEAKGMRFWIDTGKFYGEETS